MKQSIVAPVFGTLPHSTRCAKVIVIGAGLAGLAAADRLRAAYVDVLVLEARQRVGGRVKSVPLAEGGCFEAGGEFVSPGHTRFLHHASRFGLAMQDSNFYRERPTLYLRQKPVLGPQADKVQEDLTRVFETMQRDALEVDPEAPWKAPHAQAWDALPLKSWLDAQKLEPDSHARVRGFLEGGNGACLASQSYLAQLAQIKADSHDVNAMRCAGGASALARGFAEALGEGGIFTKQPVVRVDYHDGVRVMTQGGATFVGDWVVLATPPGTWANIQFNPPLPADMRPQMGAAVKYVQVHAAPLSTPCRSFSDAHVTSTWRASQRAIIAFSGGPAATFCGGLSQQDRQTFYPTYLQSMLRRSLPPVTRTYFYNWKTHPFTQGGYSIPAPKSVTRIGARWQEPHHRLWYAGEHTSAGFFGFMEGALRSGETAAQGILARLHREEVAA